MVNTSFCRKQELTNIAAAEWCWKNDLFIFYILYFLNYFFRLVKKFCARDKLKNNLYDGLCFLGLYFAAFIIDNTLV